VQPHRHRLVKSDLGRPLELGHGPVPHAERPRFGVGRAQRDRVRGDIGGAVEGRGRGQPSILAPEVDDHVEDLLGRAMDIGLGWDFGHRSAPS